MKIALTGAHGVGKTTILYNLEHPNKLQELARKYLIKDKKPSDMTDKERRVFQYKYWDLLEKTEDNHNDFISDRSLIDVLAYQLDIDSVFEVYARLIKLLSRYDILFYIPIEFPLVVDDVRSPEIEYQLLIDMRIRSLLNIFQESHDDIVRIYTIKGTVSQRINAINKEIATAITNGK